MDKRADCQLTIKDLSLLEVMLQRYDGDDGPFLRLLRRKLATATVVFKDGVDPRAATLNSRIEISVDGGPVESRILAYGGEDACPGIALPITSLLGLSLLGLTAPRTTLCERSDGTTEEVQLRRILHQPEAAKRSRMANFLAGGWAPTPAESSPD
jgi:regulator of nucleoside diphosphate kinase